MTIQPIKLDVSATIGKVSAEYMAPQNAKCIFTLAHGAGAGMNHSFMVALANALAELDISTLRFNFPFIEQKKRRPDVPAVAHKTIEAAIAESKKFAAGLPLFLSGKSFGGRMSSQYLAARNDAGIKGIIFFGFPLHPAGKPGIERAQHLNDLKVPMLFLQGTKDELAANDLVDEVCSSLRMASLIRLEGADHSFKAGKQDMVPVLAKHSSDWVENLVASARV